MCVNHKTITCAWRNNRFGYTCAYIIRPSHVREGIGWFYINFHSQLFTQCLIATHTDTSTVSHREPLKHPITQTLKNSSAKFLTQPFTHPLIQYLTQTIIHSLASLFCSIGVPLCSLLTLLSLLSIQKVWWPYNKGIFIIKTFN